MMRIKSRVGLRVLAGGLLWLLALGTLTAQTQIGELYYGLNYSNHTAEVTSGSTKYSGNIVIPESVTYSGTTYAVTSIGDYAFSGCKGLTSVAIPNSMREIGWRAFRGCTGLTDVTIADRDTVLAFHYDYYDNGKGAFDSCPIRTLYLGGDICGYSPFNCLTTLETLAIGDSVTEIGDYAFYGCTGLTSVTIGNSVTEIDRSAFEGCTGLTSIEIPSSVTKIDRSAFYGCTGLIAINVNEGNEDYSSVDGVLYNNAETCLVRWPAGKTEVDIPSWVTEIGKGAFSGCTGLTSVTIGNSVTSIGSSAFSGCTGLTSVTIGNSVTFIAEGAFEDCTGLTSIEIPNSVTYLSGFSGCTGLTSIEIPSSVTGIGSSAFEGCTGLTSIEIPNSVTAIGISAFAGCTDLTSIEIPASVTFIGYIAFRGCTGLTYIEIPSSVDTIDGGAFRGCTGLTEVTIADRETTLLFGLDYYDGSCAVFESCPIRTLYLGGNVGDLYGGEYGYSSPFCDLTTLETLTIGNAVTSIGEIAFSGCTGLTSVAMPAVTFIDYEAFWGCTGLTSVAMPAVTSIGERAFAGCSGLTSIEIPNSVTSIGEMAFSGCTGLTSVAMPAVTFIDYEAFRGCTGLTSVAMPAVTSIGSYAFAYCTGLTTFETGDAAQKIGDYAFKNCGGLLSLTFGKSVSQIGRGIVDDCDKLRRLICTSEEPAACHTNAFQDIHKIRCDLIVPETALEAYKNALVWGDFLRIAGGDGSDKVYVERLSLTSPVTPAKLKVGEGMLLSAVITPSNATNQTLTWSSSDKNVLRVDNDGYVMAVGAGEAVVTARTTDGSNLSATCTVTVTAAGSGGSGPGSGDDGDDDKILVETLEISTGGATTELQAGGTLQLSAVITPSNATNQAVTWSSSDKKVATVDNDGYVVALAAGTVVITARTTDGSDLSATCTLTVTAAGSGGSGDSGDDGPGGGNTAVEVPDALKAVRVYAVDGRIEVRGLPLGTAVTLSGVDGRLWYQTEAVTGPELTLSAPRGHVYVLRLNHTHSLKVYLP